MFERVAATAFAFLTQFGFKIIEQVPTLLRFGRQRIRIDIYYGRKSFEIGAGFSVANESFALSELIRLTDPRTADIFRNPTAVDDEGVAAGTLKVASMVREFVLPWLQDEETLLEALHAQRSRLSGAMELEVLAEQTRPLADQAFRSGDYSLALELYSRIGECLTPAERRKLEYARARCSTRH